MVLEIFAIFFLTLYTKNQIEEGSFLKSLPHISPKLEPDRDILSYSTNLEFYKYPSDSVQKIDHPFSYDQKRLSGGSDNLYCSIVAAASCLAANDILLVNNKKNVDFKDLNFDEISRKNTFILHQAFIEYRRLLFERRQQDFIKRFMAGNVDQDIKQEILTLLQKSGESLSMKDLFVRWEELGSLNIIKNINSTLDLGEPGKEMISENILFNFLNWILSVNKENLLRIQSSLLVFEEEVLGNICKKALENSLLDVDRLIDECSSIETKFKDLYKEFFRNLFAGKATCIVLTGGSHYVCYDMDASRESLPLIIRDSNNTKEPRSGMLNDVRKNTVEVVEQILQTQRKNDFED